MLREWTVSRDSGGLIWQLGVSRGFSEGNFRKVMREEWGGKELKRKCLERKRRKSV